MRTYEDTFNDGITYAVKDAHLLMVWLWQLDPATCNKYDWRIALGSWEKDITKMTRERWSFVQVYAKMLAARANQD